MHCSKEAGLDRERTVYNGRDRVRVRGQVFIGSSGRAKKMREEGVLVSYAASRRPFHLSPPPSCSHGWRQLGHNPLQSIAPSCRSVLYTLPTVLSTTDSWLLLYNSAFVRVARVRKLGEPSGADQDQIGDIHKLFPVHCHFFVSTIYCLLSYASKPTCLQTNYGCKRDEIQTLGTEVDDPAELRSIRMSRDDKRQDLPALPS